MKVIFAGTPEFALVALERLITAGFEIALVLTQPDRPAGRGLKLQSSPVKQLALAHHIPVAQPRSLRLDGKYPQDAAAARQAIAAAGADVMVVAAYGLILPQWTLDAMSGGGPPQGAAQVSGGSSTHPTDSVAARKLGCLNIHASLLPRWRGAAPIHRAIEAGDTDTGVTIMQMDAGLDTGDMLRVQKRAIAMTDTAGSLHDALAALGGQLIVEALELAARGDLLPVKQPETGVTYARKIEKSESNVDWTMPVAVIQRRIRAFDPFPGASSPLGGETIKLWKSEIDSEKSPFDAGKGLIFSANDAGLRVVCGDGVLRITELQRPGGKRLPAAEFLRGFALPAGAAFGVHAAD